MEDERLMPYQAMEEAARELFTTGALKRLPRGAEALHFMSRVDNGQAYGCLQAQRDLKEGVATPSSGSKREDVSEEMKAWLAWVVKKGIEADEDALQEENLSE